eukprot:440548_1
MSSIDDISTGKNCSHTYNEAIDECGLVFEKLKTELPIRGVSKQYIQPVLRFLHNEEYDTDAMIADTVNDKQSIIYNIIQNNIAFEETRDIVDDYINGYDEIDEETQVDNIDKCCHNIVEMDYALLLYYISMGKGNDWFDHTDAGKFWRFCWSKQIFDTNVIKDELQRDPTGQQRMGPWEKTGRSILSDFDIHNFPFERQMNINDVDTRRVNIFDVIKKCYYNKEHYESRTKLQNQYEPKCKNIKYCEALQNICDALGFHFGLKNDTVVEIASHFSVKHYKIETDFHHILKEHLQHNDKQKNHNNLRKIEHIVSRKIKCHIHEDITTCNPFLRNRNRYHSESAKKDHSADDENQYYVDLLDNIHVYFLHSYDIGFRVDQNLLSECVNAFDDENIDCHDFQQIYVDYTFKKLKEYIKIKRQNIKITEGQRSHKFTTDIEQKEQNNDSPDDTLLNSIKNESVDEAPLYSFGNRYHYWDWYMNNNEQDINNPGHKYIDWYISAKYSNFKSELLQYFTLNQYQRIMLKATKLLSESNCVKRTKAEFHTYMHHACHYQIQFNSPIKLYHLMSIISYSDFTEASYEFSRSFRRVTLSESDKSLKKRNSEYHHWSKHLRETVELYGTKLKDSGLTTFFHGISMIYFNQFDAKFCTPTSTTTQLEVAINFTNDCTGLILSLEQNPYYGGYLKYFDCSIISCYGNEDERLFVGGYKPLQFHSIRLLRKNLNMINFIAPMSLFNQVVKGQAKIDRNIKKREYEIIDELIKNQLNDQYDNRYPTYINQCFKKFLTGKRKIQIDIEALHKLYSGFISHFLQETKSVRLSLTRITNTFPNVSDILCEGGFDITLSQEDIDSYIDEIAKINDSKLKKIVIEVVHCAHDIQLKPQSFRSLGWSITVERNGMETSLILQLIGRSTVIPLAPQSSRPPPPPPRSSRPPPPRSSRPPPPPRSLIYNNNIKLPDKHLSEKKKMDYDLKQKYIAEIAHKTDEKELVLLENKTDKNELELKKRRAKAAEIKAALARDLDNFQYDQCKKHCIG